MFSSKQFDQAFPYGKSVHILKGLTAEILGDTSSDLLDLANNEDWFDLMSRKTRYDEPGVSYIDIGRQRQALALYQKNASLPAGIDTQGVAFEKFFEAEDHCAKVNKFLRTRLVSHLDGGPNASLLFQVQRKISDILGPCPQLEQLNFGFGPGANVGLSRLTSLHRKLSVRPTCTAAALKYIPYLQLSHPHWDFLQVVETHDAGKLTTVPKSALTDRCIVVEPLINTYLQKGVGSYIRTRLRNWGCNLNDQSRNQRLALQGSRDGSFATIDLQSASDTVSRELVKDLLPFDWWIMLDDFRTHFVKTPKGNVYLEKFSSMGNGFTFELESLIFYALSLVVVGQRVNVSVYGDDIIVPTHKYAVMVEALNDLGFIINSDKSFADGPFRESCGCDYFGGVSVRPCYVKKALSYKELFRLHNFFVREYREDLAKFIIRFIPKRMRLYGPDGFGDGHLLTDDPALFRVPHKRDEGWAGYVFRTYSQKANTVKTPSRGIYPALLYLNQSSEGVLRDPMTAHEKALCNPVLRNYIEPNSSFVQDLSTSQSTQTLFNERGGGKWKVQRVYALG